MKEKIILSVLSLMGVLSLVTSCNSNQIVDSITITEENNTTVCKVNDTLTFKANVSPSSASSEVIWSVNNISGEGSITSSGIFTALKMGNVEIVAASYIDSSIKATYPLTIKESDTSVTPTKITLVASNTYVEVDKTIQLSVSVEPSNASTSVTYSSSDTSIATISASGSLKGIKEGEVTITAISQLDNNIKDDITIKVIKSQDNPSIDWESKAINTFSEYINDDGKESNYFKITGKVHHICKETEDKEGNKVVSYYLVDESGGGYLIYNALSSRYGVTLGKSYEIGGVKAIYNGTHELKNIEYVKEVDTTFKDVITDITDLDYTSLDLMKIYQGGRVTLTQGTYSGTPSETKAYSVKFTKDNKEISLRVDPNNMSDNEFSNIYNKLKDLSSGSYITVNGIMNAYGYGTPSNQITILSSDDISLVQGISNEVLLNNAYNLLTIKNSIEINESKIDLPTSLSSCPGVSISYSNSDNLISSDGTLISRPNETKDTKIIATLSIQNQTLEKTLYTTIFGNNETLESVHTFDLEDALSSGSYGTSSSKSSYTPGTVTLGTPSATWNLANALIAGSDSDRFNGTFAIRAQMKNEGETKVELQNDFTFKILEFKAQMYGSDESTGIYLTYSKDNGSTYETYDRVYKVSTTELETIRFNIGELSSYRITINVIKTSARRRVNIDDIKLLK